MFETAKKKKKQYFPLLFVCSYVYFCLYLSFLVEFHLWTVPTSCVQSFTCLVLFYIANFMFAAIWVRLSVLVSVCLSHLPAVLFFMYTNISELTRLISLCSMWTDYTMERNCLPWGNRCRYTCLFACVCYCVCVVSMSSKQSGFHQCWIMSGMQFKQTVVCLDEFECVSVLKCVTLRFSLGIWLNPESLKSSSLKGPDIILKDPWAVLKSL